MDGIDYDLSDCKTWKVGNGNFILKLNEKRINKSNKNIEVQGQFSLEFVQGNKVKICGGIDAKKILMVVILLLIDRIKFLPSNRLSDLFPYPLIFLNSNYFSLSIYFANPSRENLQYA